MVCRAEADSLSRVIDHLFAESMRLAEIELEHEGISRAMDRERAVLESAHGQPDPLAGDPHV